MAKKTKINMPGSGGGIFRVSDEEGTGLKFKPEHVIMASGLIVVIELILHLYGRALL
ncbi:TPA: preprotein translocase subunit Sec61beta [archaeon]|jgi:preprotein translocase subunit Sec61beta|uniref:Preprotein translocase subunit Sec61beta n=1 Tax=Candidatus Undinarchaeum marinum TaxID=2756141 RepID=A0A832X4W9_9ARCH|nr:preprotein translocase subunit Sec61beta [Candidatus Undinarchaeum marinum]